MFMSPSVINSRITSNGLNSHNNHNHHNSAVNNDHHLNYSSYSQKTMNGANAATSFMSNGIANGFYNSPRVANHINNNNNNVGSLKRPRFINNQPSQQNKNFNFIKMNNINNNNNSRSNFNNKENKMNIKSDVKSQLKNLDEMRKEKCQLKIELELYEKTLSNDTTCPTNVRNILRNFSAQLSSLNDRFDESEELLHELTQRLNTHTQSQLNNTYTNNGLQILDDSITIRNLVQRLAKTIELYESLKIKYQKTRRELDDIKTRQPLNQIANQSTITITQSSSDNNTSTNNNNSSNAPTPNYLNTQRLIVSLKKFLRGNKVHSSTFAHKVLGISRAKLVSLVEKPAKWLACKPQKKRLYARIKKFLESSDEITELLNECLVAKQAKIMRESQQHQQQHNNAPNFVFNWNEECCDLDENGASGNSDEQNIDDNNETEFENEQEINVNAPCLNPFSFYDDGDLMETGGVNAEADDDFNEDDEDLSQHFNADAMMIGSSGVGGAAGSDLIAGELDTKQLAVDIYKYLRDHNIKQVQFAKHILGLSKSSFNKMILCPVKWTNCKPATRENFAKIAQFLQNPSKYSSQLFFDIYPASNEQQQMSGDESAKQTNSHSHMMNTSYEHMSATDAADIMLDVSAIKHLLEKCSDFIAKNRINPTRFAREVMQLSRRSLNRLLTNQINWSTCKPQTKSYLMRMRAFLQNPTEIARFLESAYNSSNLNQLDNDDEDDDVIIESSNADLAPNLSILPIVEQPVLNQTSTMINASTDAVCANRDEIAREAKRFLEKNRISYAVIAQHLFQISKRAFTRLLNESSATCKPQTKERLVKLKEFLEDESQMRDFLDRVAVMKASGRSMLANGAENEEADDDGEDEEVAPPVSEQSVLMNNTLNLTAIFNNSPRKPKQLQTDDSKEKALTADSDYRKAKQLQTDDGKEFVDADLSLNIPAIDLKQLAKKIHRFLQEHGICQRVFAVKVLGVTKNRFNKLISRPPTWQNCKSSTKQIYLIIKTFLEDKRQIDAFINAVAEEKANGGGRGVNVSRALETSARDDDADDAEEDAEMDEDAVDEPQSKVMKMDENGDGGGGDDDEDVDDEEEEEEEKATSEEENASLIRQKKDFNGLSSKEQNSSFINTKYLAKSVEKFLKENKVDESFFGKFLLDVNEASLRRLVYKPNDWHSCEQLDRQYYIKLKLFLNDSVQVNKFLASYGNSRNNGK